jgi:hypothetical protein
MDDDEVEAWLFHCWTPGKHCVFASVDKADSQWWPTDDWKGVTRTALVKRGKPELVFGEAPPSELHQVKSPAPYSPTDSEDVPRPTER